MFKSLGPRQLEKIIKCLDVNRKGEKNKSTITQKEFFSIINTKNKQKLNVTSTSNTLLVFECLRLCPATPYSWTYHFGTGVVLNGRCDFRLQKNLKKKNKKVLTTCVVSQAFSLPSTDRIRCCLTSMIEQEPVFSAWYSRWHLNVR